MQAKEKTLTITDSENIPGFKHEPSKKAFWVGLAIIAAVAMVAYIWVVVALKSRETGFEANLQKRLDLMAASQVQVMDALIETAIAQANRVVNSEIFRLYASE